MPKWRAKMPSQRKFEHCLLTPLPRHKKLTVSRAAGDDTKNATYSLRNEDHTLGNLLRNQLVKNKQVEFCAYSMPHPSEPICNVRIQIAEHATTDTDKALKGSLKRISKICDVLTQKFQASLEEFEQKKDCAMSD